jgi:hypothetical protein
MRMVILIVGVMDLFANIAGYSIGGGVVSSFSVPKP